MEDLAEEFERYAGWASDVTPLYETLASAVAADERLLEIAAETRDGQPAPQLLLAAVHSLLLGGREHELAAFYPSCGGDDRDGDPTDAFRDFCLSDEDRIRDLLSARRVQTNDVGRGSVLAPAFERVARTTEAGPLAMVELGASAGLNLSWDRYRFEYDGVGAVGDPDSPVEIATEVRGHDRPPVPAAFPPVAHRVGIDLNPLDVTDPADAHWLRALVHPDQRRRRERLEAALDTVRRDPPELVEGDALDELPGVLAAAPDEATLVVFSTHLLYQLDEETVADLRALLAERGSERPVHWLSIDPTEGLGEPVYRRVTFDGGEARESRLARFEPYGEWIRWLGN